MESIAVKYRPKVFEDLVGQEVVSKTISNSIKSGKIHHSYLFYGPRGCGKTSTARILAKSLNCQSPINSNPCNKCVSCLEITSGNSVDVVEIDAASYTQVQNIRDVIIDNVNLSPSRDKYRIYILDEVHMLSQSAFNALLKTVEEPPEHAIFIMATTEIHKVPLTIVSRCQTFKFKSIPPKLMIERLAQICDIEKIKYDKKALELIAVFSGGAMRDALSILEKIASFSQNNITAQNVSEILGYPSEELIKSLSEAVVERNIAKIHSVFERINEEGIDPISVMKELRDYYAKCFLALNNLIQMEGVPRYNPFLFSKLSRKINKIIDEVKYTDNISLLCETFLYTVIDNSVDLESIIKKLETASASEPIKEDLKSERKMEAEPQKTASGWGEAWKKVLSAMAKESVAVYNMLLSSEVKIDKDTLIISARSNLDFDMITRHKDFIEKNISLYSEKNYKVEVTVKKKIDNQTIVSDYVKEEKNELNGVKLIDISEDGIKFPELDKIKKVFSNDIMKVIKK